MPKKVVKKIEVKKPESKTESNAIVALVLGILGFFVPLCNILAIVFGFISLSNLKKNPKLEGRSMAITGIVLGIFSLIIAAIIILFILGIMGIVFFSIANTV